MNTVPIPQHWKTRDAIAYFDFLHDLLDGIWASYEEQIVPIIIADHVPQPPDPDYSELDAGDEIPF